MIRDLSKTLEAILTQPSLPAELAAAQIVFDRPVQQFNPQQTAIDLFLYDVRENLELRSSEPEIERNNATILCPPMRVDCTYLVTAWPVGGAEVSLQEHRLLSQVLQVFRRYDTIPEVFVQGSLRGQQPPLPLKISSVDGLKNPAEFWTALGTPLRAALAITVTIGVESLPDASLPPEQFQLVTERVWRIEQDRYLIEGEVKDINYEPVANATVQLVELGQSVATSPNGYYSFRLIPLGTYTLRVQRSGATAKNFPITVPAIGTGKYDLRLT